MGNERDFSLNSTFVKKYSENKKGVWEKYPKRLC